MATMIWPLANADAKCISYEDYLRALDITYPGYFPRAMDYQEPFLHVVHSEGLLTILDVSNPAGMVETGSMELQAEAGDIDVIGGTGYVVFYSLDDLQLIDVSNPVALVSLGTVEIPASPRRVAVTESYAYVPAWDYGEDNHGLYVVDVSNPQAPQVVNRVDYGDYPQNVVINEPFAYALNYDGLWSFDLSDPANPAILGSVMIPGTPVHMTTRGDQVLVVCDAEEYPAPNNGLYVVNVSDPESPWIEGSLTGDDVPHCGVGVWEPYAVVGSCGAGFAFVDLSDPGQLAAGDPIGIQGYATEFAVDGSILFALAESVASYELHEPFTPPTTSVIPDTEGSQYLVVDGQYAYTARDYGHDFCVYDLIDPERPVLVGHEPIALDFGGELAITEGPGCARYAYLGDGLEQDGFHILNITNPYDPEVIGFFPLDHSPSDLDVSGDILYAMAGYLGLVALDISDPTQPVPLDSINFGYSAQMTLVHGDTVYVGRRVHQISGLIIVDASDPSSLEIIGESAEPGQPYDFAHRDGLLYIADGEHGLLIMDVTDPTNPTTISRLRCARAASALVLEGDRVYLSDRQDHSGVLVINVADPSEPFLSGYFPATYGCDLASINGHLLVATYHHPLVVAPMECAPPELPEHPAVRNVATETGRFPHDGRGLR